MTKSNLPAGGSILNQLAAWADANPMAVPIMMVGFLIVMILPSIVAFTRRLADRRKIALVNLAGIVVFAFWLAALAWAILGKENDSAYEKVKRWRFHILGAAAVGAIGYFYLLFRLSV